MQHFNITHRDLAIATIHVAQYSHFANFLLYFKRQVQYILIIAVHRILVHLAGNNVWMGNTWAIQSLPTTNGNWKSG